MGHYAIQFAKLLGARPIIATVSSEEKAEHAKQPAPTRSSTTKRTPFRTGCGRLPEVEASIASSKWISRECYARPEDHRARWACAAYGSNAAQACFDFGPMILSGAGVRFFIVYEFSAEARTRRFRPDPVDGGGSGKACHCHNDAAGTHHGSP